MKTVRTIGELQQAANDWRSNGKRIAVVPTMGFLHDGHLSLIHIARKHADIVVTTIFVNPTQFGPNEDFTRYPRDVDRDSQLAASAGTDVLFLPPTEEMYPPGYLTYVEVEKITNVLEGKFRPTHFRGVATIVAKLFNITKPSAAVFGQKDAQQLAVIRQMVKDLNFDIEIIAAPIMRERDGLAMSSRNVYLSAAERKEALTLSQSLRLAEQLIAKGERNVETIRTVMTELISSQPSAKIDYISFAETESLGEILTLVHAQRILVSLAVHIGATRLIDNTVIVV